MWNTSKFNPLTILALLLLPVGTTLWLLDFLLLGSIILALAYLMVAIEFATYSSLLQFISLPILALTIGCLLDFTFQTWPIFILILLLLSFASVMRQIFMNYFTLVQKLYVEPILTLIAIILLIYIASAGHLWEFPPFYIAVLMPLGGALLLSVIYSWDGYQLRSQTKYGYRVKIGDTAPEFVLPDQDGEDISLAKFVKNHAVMLLFVRGDWCPGCHMLIRTYQNNRALFLEKNIHLLGIGPDDSEVNRAMLKRIGVDFKMLSDPDQVVSKEYGVIYQTPLIESVVDYEKGIPLPASFLVDKEGTIRYVSRPERVGEFLKPQLIFDVLENINEKKNK